MDLNRLLQLAGRSATDFVPDSVEHKSTVLTETAHDIVKDKTPVVAPTFPLFRSLSKDGK